MNEEEARKQLENISKNTENLLKSLDEEAPESVKKFQEMQFKNYNAIKTVLNLLEKKDKEIQFQKEINKTEHNRHKQTEKSLKGQLQKKDMIIDLMAEYIDGLDIDEDICSKNTFNPELCNEEYSNCKDCIKQYFERKVENG